MKKGLKFLSVLALSSLFAFNVNAATTCEAGEVAHTNYYMFLDLNNASYFNFDEVEQINHYTSGQKWNNIKGATIISMGNVSITNGTKETNSGANVKWTAPDYWKRYAAAVKGADAKTLIYEADDTTSYILHSGWMWYTNDKFENGVQKYSKDDGKEDKLADYINSHSASLATDELVTKGTALPNTTVKDPGEVILSTSTDDAFEMRVYRSYLESTLDGLTGTTVDGAFTNAKIYAPAAYYITFCEAKATEPEPEKKVLTYDKNIAETVENMPGEQDYSTSPITLSDKTPKTDKWVFMGWNTDAKASDGKYQPSDKYSEESTTLYAIWRAKEYTVTYDANKGTGAPKAETGTYEKCLEISSVEPKRDGFKFLGWSRKKDAVEPDKIKEYCGEDGDITLYAVWSPKTGITTHVVAFAIVAVAAGAALVVARKKNLFKQI